MHYINIIRKMMLTIKEIQMKNYLTSIFVLILTVFPGVIGYATGQQYGEEKVVAVMDEQGVQHIDVIGGEYYFGPKNIVVKVNSPVQIRVKKTGGFIPHNIIVKAPEAGIDFKLDLGGEFQTVNFTPTKTGTYTMYCDSHLFWFKTHQEKGMEGTIEVVE